MKFLRVVFLTFLASLPMMLWAQQEAMFTHYVFNRLFYNAAYAGTESNKICATLTTHNQWMGFKGPDGEGAPVSQVFSIHSPVGPIAGQNFGVGLVALNDGLGFENNFNASVPISWRRQLGPGTLSAGVTMGVQQKSLDAEKLRAVNPNDPLLNQLRSGSNNDIVFDFGMGLYYYTKKYFGGVSVAHLFEPEYKWQTQDNNKLERLIYLTGGYNFEINNDFTLAPMTLMKISEASFQFDLGALLHYKKFAWGGLSGRQDESLIVMAGISTRDLPQGLPLAGTDLAIGLSYDIVLNSLSSFNSGTFELMVKYCFTIPTTPKNPPRQFSPRFLNGYTL